MKFKLVLPIVAAFILFQLVPQAAWSQCGWHGGYGYGGVSRAEAHRIWRAEHCGYGYGAYAPAPVYPYGGYGYHRGLLGGFARAIL